ncbi:molybdate ABC transporter substrate-binding protein [Thermodesulfomicrobium sp. WS]|uniref:molybdate ABC transporter substrate-binding protein n=1 Tax=Thermodesulfomicrobium sp. WS TaxID=3004129 RepID=UPI0024922F15|nr:molybdate ABC transporter substrate-binding protein [Thermodesulfomicrobium sp. WS]
MRTLMVAGMVMGFAWVCAAEERPMVAAAASLKFAFSEVAEEFQRQTGMSVRLNFGSSGNFRRQILQGAPYEVFFSADEENVLALHAQGFAVDAGRTYARGRVVLLGHSLGLLGVGADLSGMVEAVRSHKITHFAIANPEHVPYGMRAQEILRRLGVWEEIQPRLVVGENVGQAAQFILEGGADAGLVPLALVLSPSLAGKGEYVLVPEQWHTPLLQRGVLLKGAGPVAQAFYQFVFSAKAREILERYGFVPLGGGS